MNYPLSAAHNIYVPLTESNHNVRGALIAIKTQLIKEPGVGPKFKKVAKDRESQ